MSTHQEFGASVGKALFEAGTSDDAPRVAAAQFIGGVVDVHPRVKLPALLGNNAVREWMERVGISESMLRTVLTTERRARREKAAKEPTVRVPPKARARRASTPEHAYAKSVQSAGGTRFGSDVVPNRSLDLL